MLVSLQRMPVRLPLVLFLSAVERRLVVVHQDFVAESALWFLTFWSSGRAQAALWSQFGPAGAERQLALAVLLSVVLLS